MSSKIEESINLFNGKCAQLDLPPECYPESQYLQKIFRQNMSFFELFMQKVDTKQAINAIRKNILVAHMKNSTQETKGLKTHDLLPKEFKKFIQYNQMLEKLKYLKEQQYYLTQEENHKMEAIQKNEIQIVKRKESLRLNKVKVDLLEAKSINIYNSIREEEDLRKKIKDIIPASFSSSDSIEDFSKNINQCINLLKEFSTDSDNSNTNCKNKYWKEIETRLKKVPNNVTFQMIMKRLNSKIENSFLSLDSNIQQKTKKESISEKLLPILYQLKIISGIEMIAQKKKLENSKKVCAENIQVFENEVESLLNASIDYSFQLEEDDIVGEFLSVLIAKVNLEGKVQFCIDNVNSMKQQVETNYEYEQLTNDTRVLHRFIEEKITSIQEQISLLHHINEKINFSKLSVMRMIQSLKLEKSQQHNRTLLNQTFNSTIAVSKECEISLPQYELELQQFLDIPIQSFDRTVSINKLILSINDNIFSDIMQINGHISNNLHNFLDDLKKRFKFKNIIKSISNEIPSQIDITIAEVIDYSNLLKQRTENSEEICGMLDEISRFNKSIKVNLEKIISLHKFAAENPLRKYVPKTKYYDGKNYEFYEKEYMLYYKMIKKN